MLGHLYNCLQTGQPYDPVKAFPNLTPQPVDARRHRLRRHRPVDVGGLRLALSSNDRVGGSVTESAITRPTSAPVSRSLPLALAAGALIGVLGGMIGLGGAEFRLPLLTGLFGFIALQAVIVNKADEPDRRLCPLLDRQQDRGGVTTPSPTLALLT